MELGWHDYVVEELTDVIVTDLLGDLDRVLFSLTCRTEYQRRRRRQKAGPQLCMAWLLLRYGTPRLLQTHMKWWAPSPNFMWQAVAFNTPDVLEWMDRRGFPWDHRGCAALIDDARRYGNHANVAWIHKRCYLAEGYDADEDSC